MKIKVWDVELRLFHWLLVAAFVTAYFTSKNESFLDYHTAAGYVALGLVVFRLVWGFAGNRYATFSGFLRGWGEVRSYLGGALRLAPPRYIGHNPAVGWVVVGMLSATAVLTLSGVVTYGGEEKAGFFSDLFSYGLAQSAKSVHLVLADLMIVMIVVHVSAALFHDFILRENIILSMITGKKEDDGSYRERLAHMSEGEGRSPVRLAAWLMVAIMGGAALLWLPPQGRKDFSQKNARVYNESGLVVTVKPLPVWKEECASACHAGFSPVLLPENSWRKLFDGLGDHFGEDASLDEQTARTILEYLVANSAGNSTTEASRKIMASLKPGEAPLRVTDTPYWKDKHSGIAPEVFERKSVVSKSNCIACHPGAEVGSFEDSDIGVPEK